MRSFSKKLAFVLAAAMVVTAFAPAAKAEAAKEMAINKSSQILYVNEGINHKGADGVAAGKGNVSVYDFSVKNKPADWKTAYKFVWSSQDPEIVTVEKGGVAKAVAVGKTTVYCKVTEKATGEVTTLKTKVTVKANAAKVEITNADDWDGATVEVGGKPVDLNRAMYDENGEKTTKRGTLVTDYTKWVAEFNGKLVGEAEGVKITQSNGKYEFTEAAEAGSYKLYCYTYQSSKYTKATATSEPVVVEFVKDDKFELAQTAANGFKLTFGKATDLKVSDVAVERVIKYGESTSEFARAVADVTMSEDKKTAYVTMFNNFENGLTYEVTVKGFEEAVTFVAKIGAPESMTISSKSWIQGGAAILVGENSTELTYKLFDKDGIDVTSAVTEGYVVFSAANTTTTDYFVDNGCIVILTDGAEAVVNAEYHTGQFDENANETVIKATGRFIGVTTAPNSIASVSITPKYWGNPLSKMAISLGAVDLEVKIKTTAQWDQENVYKNYDYIEKLAVNGVAPQVRYHSSNVEIFDVQGDQIVLFQEGTAAVIVSLVTWNADGTENETTVAAKYLTVGPKSVVSGVSLAGSNIVVGVEPLDKDNYYNGLAVAAKDQYGFEWGLDCSIDKDGEQNKDKVPERAGFAKVKFADGTVIVENARDSVYFRPRRSDNGYKDLIIVDGPMMLADMQAAGYVTVVPVKDKDGKVIGDEWYVDYGKSNERKVTSITKRVIVETTAQNPDKNAVSFTFNVTVKKAVGTVVTTIEANGTTSGNVGRFNTPYDYNNDTEKEKTVSFAVFNKQNGLKVAQLPLEGVKPSDNKVPAEFATDSGIGTLYFTLTRNNNSLASLINPADPYAAVRFNGKTVELDYSDFAEGFTKDQYDAVGYAKYNGSKNVDLGAGTYTFTVYKVAKNSTTGKFYFAYVGATSTNVSVDTGSYTFVKRVSETVKDYTSAAAIRECFKINGLDGNETKNPYTVDVKESGNFIHVNSITFYEKIDGYDVYAPYKVNINLSLKK